MVWIQHTYLSTNPCFAVHKGTNKLRWDPAKVHTCVGGYIFCQKINTVDGSEIRQAPVEVDSLSHYLPRFLYIPGGDLRISEASMFFNMTYVTCFTSIARWWFQIYLFDVHPENWGRWTHFDYYFFRWVETTNQIVFHLFNYTRCTQIHQHLCSLWPINHGCFPKGLGLQRVWVDSVALDALKSWEFSRKLGGLVGWIQSYSQLMIGMSFITETKRICFFRFHETILRRWARIPRVCWTAVGKPWIMKLMYIFQCYVYIIKL